MPNVGQVLKQEFARLAKKEVRAGTTALKADSVKLKKANADLKRRIAQLEKDNRRLVAAEDKRLKEAPQVAPQKAEKARITAKGMRSLRKKLGLSQAGFATLLGVSSQSVQLWEKKEGALAVRDATRAAIVSIRGIGAREAKARLEKMAKPAQGKKKPARKKAVAKKPAQKKAVAKEPVQKKAARKRGRGVKK